MSDESNGYPGAPPGWYPDPAGGPGQRWWDGYDWTEATVQPAVPPPPPAPSPHWTSSPPVYGAAPHAYVVEQDRRNAQGPVGDELRLSNIARFAIAFSGISYLITLVGWVANSAQYRVYGHQLHLYMDSTAANRAVPTFPNSLGAGQSLLVLAAIAAITVKCIWQFRAATAARALQLPARHSPGWGVAFRFIPIVNFWMPYQAVRDCLAPDDPNRAVLARWWMLVIGMDIGGILTLTGLLFSTPVGVVFAILTGLCALAFLATAPKVVTTIAAAHQAAVNP